MKIIHIDVDTELNKYLDGEKYEFSLEELPVDKSFEDIEILTIKSFAAASKKTLAPFSNLKLLITRTVGTDHIDLDYCKEKGIEVKNILDYGSFNIAEHAFALLLAGTRNIIHSQNEIKKGVFSYEHNLGIALKGKTIGVVGTGRIGLETIRIANGFGMNVLAYDITPRDHDEHGLIFTYVSLEELIKKSDIISLHAPYHDSTKHMINDETISAMKEGVILINTARGGLIDNQALIKHIKKFRWVGLDVVEDEHEFFAEHPLLKFDNVLITPHIAFFSDASVKKIAEETKRIIAEYEN